MYVLYTHLNVDNYGRPLTVIIIGVTHILEDGRKIPQDCPPFLTLSFPIGSLFYAQLDLVSRLFLQKISICLYHI